MLAAQAIRSDGSGRWSPPTWPCHALSGDERVPTGATCLCASIYQVGVARVPQIRVRKGGMMAPWATIPGRAGGCAQPAMTSLGLSPNAQQIDKAFRRTLRIMRGKRKSLDRPPLPRVSLFAFLAFFARPAFHSVFGIAKRGALRSLFSLLSRRGGRWSRTAGRMRYLAAPQRPTVKRRESATVRRRSRRSAPVIADHSDLYQQPTSRVAL
jgi:hypothetical protein